MPDRARGLCKLSKVHPASRDSARGDASSVAVDGVLDFSEAHRQWIERADTFFIGSVHEQAGMDCSHRGGNPGFVRVKDELRVVFADYSGNNMFQTLGNLSLDSRAALIFLDFETGGTLQASGRAKIIWDEAFAR